MSDVMSITDMLARLRDDAADERFEGARLGPTAVRELLRHIDALRRERDELAARQAEIEAQPPVAWIEHELQGTGLRHLHFERRPNTLRDDVVAPVWTELIARPTQAAALELEPTGWKVVPVDPTPGMVDAADSVNWCDGDTRGSAINMWHLMLAAAPERAEPQPRLICSSNGLLGASSGVGRECDYWAGGVCTSPHPCQHQQQTKPCRCRRCLTDRGDSLVLMILCPTCGNKRCPHATDHRHACTGSNEPGQPGSWYGGMPEQAKPCRTCDPDGRPDSVACPRGER